MPTLFLVFEKLQSPEMCFESRALSSASSEIDILTDRAGLKMLLDYTHVDLGELFVTRSPEAPQTPTWFSAQEGVDWLTRVIELVRKDSSSLQSPERVLADLTMCRGVLQKACAAGLRWRFGLDL